MLIKMTSNIALTSRHRDDVATLFDVFCEVGCDGEGAPFLLTKYPDDYCEESILKSVAQFSFPCNMKDSNISSKQFRDSEAVQLFSFVLTDAQSKYTFGYCRYTPRNNTCLCILTGFPWPGVFYKILNHVSNIMNQPGRCDLDKVLTRIYHSSIPDVDDHMSFTSETGNVLEVDIPDIRKLPTLKDDKFLLEFYNAVPQKQMMALYASLLKERRIIVTGRKLSQLSSCVCAAATLLNPMFWQSVFIPVLPEKLIDMLMAPMPFLIGVPKKVMQSASIRELGDVVIVDLDDRSLQSSHDDLADMPYEVVAFLKTQLRNSNDMGDLLARTFLRCNVLLFGGYQTGFVRKVEHDPSSDIVWDREKFVQAQKPTYQPFLKSLTHGVQYLERFIDERLLCLNSGQQESVFPGSIEFEKEAKHMDSRFKAPVKDNANDMIGALKDRVSGIQIGAKLNRLTPRDMRKSKISLKRNAKQGFEPMSFDNVQWNDLDRPSSGTSSRSSREDSPLPDSSSHEPPVPIGDLIDLTTPGNIATSPLAELDPFAQCETSAGQSRFYSPSSSHIAPVTPAVALPPLPPQRQTPQRKAPPVPAPRVLSLTADPFADPFRSPENQAPPPPSRNWERFD